MSRYIETRWSHLLGYSGVGAVVRADDDLFVVADIKRWTDRDGIAAGDLIPYVDLLRATLGIAQDLRQPPLARQLPNGAIDGVCVPAMRFPGWTRCPSPQCGLLHWRPWRTQADGGAGRAAAQLRCVCERRPRLQQVDWVLAHPQGGLWEVPWHMLAHQGAGVRERDCRADGERAYLRLRRAGPGGSGWVLGCDRCGARARFDPAVLLRVGDPGRQPWERYEPRQAGDDGEPRAQILEVSDPRLYYPRTRRALSIPPESRVRRGSVLDRLYSNRKDCDDLARCRTPLSLAGTVKTLAGRYGCAADEIAVAWEEIRKGYPLYGQTVTPGQLLVKEHRALCEEIPDLADSEDFVPRHRTDAWRALAAPPGSLEARVLAAVDRLVAVTRLREIAVFTGFTRIGQGIQDDGLRPESHRDSADDAVLARAVPPDLDGSLDWLPAIELYGEGIFLTLAEPLLARWAAQPALKARTGMLERRFEGTGMRFPDAPALPLAPRFVLLHTLAHLLIRQLETGAGYPAASLRERIYCAEGPEPMAGILVYVAVPDIVGSLGGLAELAEPGRFLPLLAGVFAHADWCSLDPVCGEHEGQGPSQLNLAACHACALVPEPSCQLGNVLLDRVFVRGDLGGDIRPLLDFAASAEP